jgi:hypothetical protein
MQLRQPESRTLEIQRAADQTNAGGASAVIPITIAPWFRLPALIR